jgi:signal peptidase II
LRTPALTGRRPLVALFVILSTVGCDRATKCLAQAHLKGAPPRSFLGDAVRLQYTENPGAFLGFGAGWSSGARLWTFTVAGTAALLLVAIHVLRHQASGLPSLIAGSLIVAGGLGNLWDRVLGIGRVPDFLNLGLGPIRTGIFNVADLALSVGLVLLFVSASRREWAVR